MCAMTFTSNDTLVLCDTVFSHVPALYFLCMGDGIVYRGGFWHFGSLAVFANAREKMKRWKGFTREILSAYAQLKWGIFDDRLNILAGGRVDDYSDSGSKEIPKDFETQFSPRGGVIFLPTEKSALKALYGRAFKAPIQLQLFGFPGLVNGSTDLEPETIDVYELIYIYQVNS